MNDEDPRYGHGYLPPEVLDRISKAIQGVRFGSVEVVIQDGKVIQIERKEKFRIER
ncbi:MAG: YezD family protein [Candidatus Binataceae bacterium]